MAKDWYANGVPLTLTGKLEMFQQSEYGITNVEVGFKGLIENSGYHVHIVSILYKIRTQKYTLIQYIYRLRLKEIWNSPAKVRPYMATGIQET